MLLQEHQMTANGLQLLLLRGLSLAICMPRVTRAPAVCHIIITQLTSEAHEH